MFLVTGDLSTRKEPTVVLTTIKGQGGVQPYEATHHVSKHKNDYV